MRGRCLCFLPRLDVHFHTTIPEPLEVTVLKELPETFTLGTGDMAEYTIHNTGGLGIPVTVTWPASSADDPLAVFCTIRYITADGTSLDDIVRVDYTGSCTFTLKTDSHDTSDGKSSYAKVQLSVLAFYDAPPGPLNIFVEVFRG